MIPTIDQIIADLLAGAITAEQAQQWINEHIRLAEEQAQGDLRDCFAGQAMQAYMAWSLQQPPHEDDTAQKASLRYANTAYLVADAMLKARQS